MCVSFRRGWLSVGDFAQNNAITPWSFTLVASASITAPHGNSAESSPANSMNHVSPSAVSHRAVTASTRWTPTDRRPTPLSTTTSATPLTTTPGAASRKAYPERRPTATPSPSRATRITVPHHRCLLYLRCHLSSVHPAPSRSRPRDNPRVKEACLDPKVAGLPPLLSRAPTLPASTAPSTGPPAA